MPTLSPFQTLPLHVVRIIVEHVVGSSRVRFAQIMPDCVGYKVLLRPLLWVCHNFRAVAYPRYCRYFYLDLNRPACDELEARNFESDSVALGYPTHRFAKDLMLELSGASIISGRALEELSRAPYNGCAFPLLRLLTTIVIMDYSSEDIEADPLVVEANIKSFVQRIKDMAPMVNEIRVEVDSIVEQPEIPYRHFGDLISQLLRLADRISYNDVNPTPVLVAWQLNDICGLSHIKAKFESDDSRFIQLARQNAQTLQSLNIHTRFGSEVPSLIQNADGGHVTYPQLLTLRLLCSAESSEQRRTFFNSSVVPFPSLRCIDLPHSHPFGDDTLFRGNAMSLERLEMELDSETVAMLRNHNVFMPTSHQKLQSVGISFFDDLTPDVFATAADCLRFVLNIGSRASVREFRGYMDEDKFIPALSTLGDYACIQVLVLSNMRLDLWQTIALVKLLPLLSDLTAASPNPCPLPDGIMRDELPAYVVSTYAPMGVRFRCWHFIYESGGTDCYGMESVFLLALACPNFTFMTQKGWSHELLVEEAKPVIALDMFKEYAPRLQCFLDR